MHKLPLVMLLSFTIVLSSCGNKEPEVKREETLTNVAQVAISDDPTSLDPRSARDLTSLAILRLLFDGLTRVGADNQVELAVAESVDVSFDKKTYTFHLRESSWSNVDPVTAHDFEYAWKKALEPSFVAPNAYQLYPIRGAKAAKEGTGSMDDVGAKALDARTLQVELENPTPYFLKLTSLPIYFPVNSQWEQAHSDWATEVPKLFVGNGPFKVREWHRNEELELIRNPAYWDATAVKLQGIAFVVQEENTALLLFQKGELNWVGSPLSMLPPDSIPTLRASKQLQIAPAAGTQFLRFNVDKSPFSNRKIRQAFAYAIDREAIATHILQGNQMPATGLLPPSLQLKKTPYFEDHDISAARRLFNEGLLEMGLTRKDLPPIVLSYTTTERYHKIAQAVQQQWNQAFDINVDLQNFEGKVMLDKIHRGDYQMSLGSWFADIPDPINFLEVFKLRNNGTNNTGWENTTYTALLNASDATSETQKRDELMQKAEELLIEEMPIAPIYYFTFNYMKSPSLRDAHLSDLGVIELKSAAIADADDVELDGEE